MDRKTWLTLKAKIKKLPLERRLAPLQTILKKEKKKILKKEIGVEVKRVEQQLFLLAEWKKRGFSILQAMQASQQTPAPPTNTITEAQREEALQRLQEAATLEEVLAAAPEPTPAMLAAVLESATSYGPSSEYVPGADYAPAASYAPNQYDSSQSSITTQLLFEQKTAVQEREREEKERTATRSDRSTLEGQEFAEYKPRRQRRTI